MTALITAFQAITLGLIGLIDIRLGRVKTEVGQVKADAAAAREQVENNHDTNLREENDVRHEETRGWIDSVRRLITSEIRTLRTDVGKDIGGIRQELRDDRRDNNASLRALDGRVTAIEQKDT